MLDTIQNLVKALYTDFSARYKITDYPKLHDVFAIIATESSWDPNAESKHAKGLMQVSESAVNTINAIYNTSYTYNDMLNPSHNVSVGLKYLRWLWRAFEKFECREMLTVLAYNWGIGNVIKWLSEEKDNTKIDESVPKESKDYLVQYIYWKEKYRKVLKT